MTVWRLARVIYQDLSSAGGLKYKGRWNQPGLPIIYTSGSPALSILERRVHSFQQPEDEVLIEITIPDNSIEHLSDSLPKEWKTDLDLTRGIGAEWLRSKRSLCLRVPSAVAPEF